MDEEQSLSRPHVRVFDSRLSTRVANSIVNQILESRYQSGTPVHRLNQSWKSEVRWREAQIQPRQQDYYLYHRYRDQTNRIHPNPKHSLGNRDNSHRFHFARITSMLMIAAYSKANLIPEPQRKNKFLGDHC